MISIGLDLNTNCKACGNPLPINALAEHIECSICQKTADFPYDFWRTTILADAINDAPDLADGQGKDQQNMAGEYTFHLIYGRQKPRCAKCRTLMDNTKFEEYSRTGSAACSCGSSVSVRALPEELSKLFYGVKYLVGEDAALLFSDKSAMQTPNDSKPVLFTCPACAGNLEVDGTSRMIVCKYCSSEVYLPDNLWLKLHPVKTISRWYLAFEEKTMNERLPKWRYISDLVIDKDGFAYFITSPDGVEDTIVWSMEKDFKPRWITKTANYGYDNCRLAVSSDGILYAFNIRKNSLLKISCNDGSILGNIKINLTDGSGGESDNSSGVSDLIVDSDGSLLCFMNDKIARFTSEGESVPVWSGTKHDGSFFSKVSKIINSIDGSGDSAAPDVNELKDKPYRIDTGDVFIKLGLDGFIYIMDQNQAEGAGIVRYDHSGKKDWGSEIPLDYRCDKPHIDSSGNVFVLGDTDDDEHRIMKFNKASNKWETLMKEISDGGLLCGESFFAISGDGKIYLADSDNCLKVFDENLKNIYISAESKENDQDERDDGGESDDDNN